MGRGKLVFVRHRRINSPSAELDPEATRSTDQKLTELELKGVHSDNNTAILREREKALDRWEHIKSGLPATHKDVLLRVLDVIEPGDSVYEIARKANLYAPQVGRAFHAAREADKLRIFKQASKERRPPAISYRPYNPKGVSMETVMIPHRGPVLSRLLRGEQVGGWELESELHEWYKRDPVRKAFVDWKNCRCLREKPGTTQPCEECTKNKAIWKQAMTNGYNGPNSNP
jgi:hypothetical protein